MKPLLAFIFALLFVSYVSGPAFAYEGWIGTYVEEEKVSWSATTEKRFGNHGLEEYAEGKENTDFEVNVRACFLGNGSEPFAATATATFTHKHDERCQLKTDYELCCGKDRSIIQYAASRKDRKEGCDRGPGEFEDFTLNIRGNVSGEPKINMRYTSLLVREEKGEYQLKVKGEVPTKITKETKGEYNYACRPKKQQAPKPHSPEISHYRTFGQTVELRYSGEMIAGENVIFEESGAHLGRRGFHDGGKFCRHPSRKITDDYHIRQTARWFFKKACFGVIRTVKGDVTMTPASRPSGEAKGGESIGQEKGITPGCVTNHGGAVIKTGRQSRLGIDLSDSTQIRIGPNSKIELPKDPCAKGKGIKVPITYHIYGLVNYMFGSDEPFEVHGPTAATGVRGKRQPFPGFEPERAFAMLKDSFISTAMAEEKEPDEVMPEEAEIRKAKTVFMVDHDPNGYFYVKVIKGAVRLEDSSGYTKDLKAGQTFTKKWKSPVRPSDLKEVVIKAL